MACNLIPGDVTIKAIKAIKPGDPRTRLSDGDGLYLRLFVKGGSHGWRLDYSVKGVRKNLPEPGHLFGYWPGAGTAQGR